MILLTKELAAKLDRADRVEIHYKPPHVTKHAVVEYSHQQDKPLKVVSYYIYGEELKTGKPLICWRWVPSTNFKIIEDGFYTEEEAKARLKELRRIRHAYETNN